jgi:GlpG protein
MRLIGEFTTEKEVFGFQAFLQSQKINTVYDLEGTVYHLWALEEDDFEKALQFYVEWKKNPKESRFNTPPAAKPTTVPPVKTPLLTLNNLVLFLCTLLFILNLGEEEKTFEKSGIVGLQNEMTPLEKRLVFDYPVYNENIEKFLDTYAVRTPEQLKALPPEAKACFDKVKNAPTWKGLVDLFVTRNWKSYTQLPEGTLFGKIRQGEIWRLFTPVLLHGGILHILFNMVWVWMVGKLIEQRIGAFKYLLLSIVIAVFSNTAQYVMSGPNFFGYSGIVVGLIGFIWMRQKIAPWEGYPLHPSVIRFIAIYVAALLVLGLISIFLDFFHVTELYANIANTAHIVGGLTGIFCAKLTFFSRAAK